MSEMKRFVVSPFVLVGGVATILFVGGAYILFDFQSSKEIEKKARAEEKIAEQQAEGGSIRISNVEGNDPSIVEVVQKVSKHIVLPDGRVAVATITNIEQLRQENPVLYRFAKNGDKVLVYPNEIIVYNQEMDKVLDLWHEGEVLTATTKQDNEIN